MKDLHGSAGAAVAAPVEKAYALLVDLERYPRWYPEVVRGVRVVERGDDGHPTRAETTLHLAYGPVVRDFHLLIAVAAEAPRLIRLTRIPHEASDPERFEVTWRLRAEGGTRVDLDLAASLSVPRLLPVGGIGDAMAEGFINAARRALAA